jgi:hypothetical protein
MHSVASFAFSMMCPDAAAVLAEVTGQSSRPKVYSGIDLAWL